MVISTVVVLLCSAFMILPVYNALALGKFDFSDPDYSFQTMFKPLELLACLLPNQYYSVTLIREQDITDVRRYTAVFLRWFSFRFSSSTRR